MKTCVLMANILKDPKAVKIYFITRDRIYLINKLTPLRALNYAIRFSVIFKLFKLIEI